MKTQSRRWIYASVAAIFLFTLIITQLDNQKLYSTLQSQLTQSGVTLTAENISLSLMYTGSIRLDHAQIQTSSFNLQAERIFIDLDLAALLTGKALPRALYIQLADINIHKTQQEGWLEFINHESFKLKRINISQSEIHLEEQHITLEQVNLDVRDIGKNKNPRVELQAHIGEGRLDAHGYLRLKRGEITRGFGRLKIYDVPLTFFDHGTSLETLHGSVTAHLNKDKSWQSFGHLSVQSEQQDTLELRGKIGGNDGEFITIDDMILSMKESGVAQISGGCAEASSCQISLDSKSIKLSSLSSLFKSHTAFLQPLNNELQDIHIQSTWDKGVLTNQGSFAWSALQYQPTQKQANSDKAAVIQLDLGKATFSGLTRNETDIWALNHANFSTLKDTQEITLKQAAYSGGELELTLELNNTPLWLPLGNLALISQGLKPEISGQGMLNGQLALALNQDKQIDTAFNINASDAEILWKEVLKPQGIKLVVQGDATWNQTVTPSLAKVDIQLADAYANIHLQPNKLSFENTSVDVQSLIAQNIVLPSALQTWHGAIQGDVSINLESKIIETANARLEDFGSGQHFFSGQLLKNHNSWHTTQLEWLFNKNKASINTTKFGTVNLVAETLDTEGLAYLLQAPYTLKGRFINESLSLPFGTIKNVFTYYQKRPQQISFENFKGTLYEGTLRAKNVSLLTQNNQFALEGAFQVGGIHLNKWNWFDKQFQTHLQGTVYATLNLGLTFDETQQLSAWQGDGDVVVYNGQWLLNSKTLKADKLSLTIRKREKFTSQFKIKHGEEKGSGEIQIDEQFKTTGQLDWKGKAYTLTKDWPNIRFE
ncbi:MAG: hypothetical protein R8M46_00230 [Ghiorsea sp.]